MYSRVPRAIACNQCFLYWLVSNLESPDEEDHIDYGPLWKFLDHFLMDNFRIVLIGNIRNPLCMEWLSFFLDKSKGGFEGHGSKINTYCFSPKRRNVEN